VTLVGMDTLNTSTPETFLQDPPVAESGHTALGSRPAFRHWIRSVEFRKTLRWRQI